MIICYLSIVAAAALTFGTLAHAAEIKVLSTNSSPRARRSRVQG
jgi:hypothetical protein